MIEDNRSVVTIVEGYLRQQLRDLQFYHTPTLALATHTLRRKPFDVVLLDIELPDGNGLDWLKHDTVMMSQQCPVIVLSSSDKIRTVFAAINAGAEQYLDKSMASVAALPGLINEMTHSGATAVKRAA